MDKYEVLWLNTSQRDTKKILDYISFSSSLKKSKEIFTKIKKKAKTLTTMPEKGRIVPELNYFNINTYRELILGPWRIIYKIEDKKVYVSSVIDGRRNVEDILLQRFL